VVINYYELNDFIVLEVTGEIIKNNESKYLCEILDTLIDSGKRRIGIDLSYVSYADSELVNIITRYNNRLSQKENGSLMIVSPNEIVCKLLKVSRIDQNVEIVYKDVS